MSLNVGTVQATAELNMRRFSQGMGQMRKQGASSSADVQKSLGGIGTRLTSIAFLAKTALGSALVVGAKKAVNEFALLEGSMAKFNVVFAEQSKEMERWVGTIRERMPLANREIIAAAASMQDLLVPMGIAREQATGMTKEWLELAASLAAFNDVPVDQALEAIRSGIAGQSRPLRAFGIDARETAIQQTALAAGLLKTGEVMTEQVRQQALLLRAYEQSKDAIDGYEDQLGSTLIMEQNLAATYKDTAAMIGETLQPAYNRLLKSMTGNLKTLQNLFGGFSKLFDDVEAGMKRAFQDDTSMDDMRHTMTLLSEAIERTELQLRRSGGAKEYAERLDDLNSSAVELQALMALMAQEDPIENMSDSAVDARKTFGDLKKQISDLEGEIDKSFDSSRISEFRSQIEDVERLMAGMMGELKPDTSPSEVIYDLSEAFKDANNSLDGLVGSMEDFSSSFINVGSIGDLESQIQSFEEHMRRATDPEQIQVYKQKIEELRAQIALLNGELEGGSGAARYFSTTLADGLTQVLFQAQSVEDALKNIIKQLASRALVTGLMALFSGGLPAGVSFGKAMFGGQFHTGGIVGGTGEKTIIAKGGEGVFTPSQMKAMGGATQQSAPQNMSVKVHVVGKLQGEDIYITSERAQVSWNR